MTSITRHFRTLHDINSKELVAILDTAAQWKAQHRRGIHPPLLERRVLALLFEKPSLRTRVSFETLMYQLGGGCIYLSQDVGWGNREPIKDFIPVLSSYVDAIVMRTMCHETIEQAAKFSSCPIINGLSDRFHPCQILGDLLTIRETFDQLASVKLAYFGDANNVARSLAIAASYCGLELAIACPESFQFERAFIDQLNQLASARIWQTTSCQQAAAGAQVIYTDVWTSMGQENQREERENAFRDFQVDSRLMALASSDAVFMHCLPAVRGQEVTSEVIDGPQSVVVRQAENRLHGQKGLLVWLLGKPAGQPAIPETGRHG